VELHADIEIVRPAAEVFAYISNFENNPKWQGGMRSAAFRTAPPLRVGSEYDQTASFLGRPVDTRFRVTALQPGASITIESIESTFPIKVTRRVEPVGEGRSRVSAHIEGSPGGLMRLASPLVRRIAQRSVTSDYRRLKALLEGSAV
jgi:uncharacterized membrane protein